jgi:hypothetical protein
MQLRQVNDTLKGPLYDFIALCYTKGMKPEKSVMYVDGDIHVNGVENFWSLLKRGLTGIFHEVSVKALASREREDNLLALVLANCKRRHIAYAELVA